MSLSLICGNKWTFIYSMWVNNGICMKYVPFCLIISSSIERLCYGVSIIEYYNNIGIQIIA